MTKNIEQILPKRPPGYEDFFMPLRIDLTPNEVESIGFAYVASKYGHGEEIRDDGTRYFDHPKAAAWIYIDELQGRDPRVIIDVLLHDMGENSYLLSPHRLRINFDKEGALDVGALTKKGTDKNGEPKETTEEYLLRVIIRGAQVIIAKLLDRLHNMRTLACCTPEKQKEQLEETKKYHIPLLITALRACGEEYQGFADFFERKLEKECAKYE